jgi:CheY-specific phosphatase CheX
VDPRDEAIVATALRSAVVELFASYGMACVEGESSGPEAETQLASMIGFSGRNIRGGLAFAADPDLIADLLPVARSAPEFELQVRDWLAEMTNQLLGRLKNKVATAAFDFKVGTPACFSGTSVRVRAVAGEPRRVGLTFRAGNSTVRVHLDVATSGGLSLAAPAGNPPSIPEGDVLLF